MNLKEIASVETWKQLEREIFQEYRLNAAVFDLKGNRITEFRNFCNPLCSSIKGHKDGASFICANAQLTAGQDAEDSENTVIIECDGGFVKIVVPIFAKHLFLGTVSGCGRLREGAEPDGFLIEKTTGIPEIETKSLSKDIGVITEAQIQTVVSFIKERLAEIIRSI